MITHFICIPCTANIPTHIFSERNVLKYVYSREILYDNKLDYFDGHVFSDDLVCSRDICLIIDPDGSAYTEVCASTDFIDDRHIFNGIDGTRCLLCDVKKIVETTNVDLQTDVIMPIQEGNLINLLKERNCKRKVPDFFN